MILILPLVMITNPVNLPSPKASTAAHKLSAFLFLHNHVGIVRFRVICRSERGDGIMNPMPITFQCVLERGHYPWGRLEEAGSWIHGKI